MEPTGHDIGAIISRVASARRRRDAETLVDVMREVSGREPVAWGSIIGFGACHYRYPTGNEGDMPVLAFAPRAQASTIYLDSTDRHRDALTTLGPHTVGKGCLYIKDLEAVDLDVLHSILESTRAWTEAGGSDGVEITVTG